jgi:hypothetical protein
MGPGLFLAAARTPAPRILVRIEQNGRTDVEE